MAAEVHSDLNLIQDEDILRRMWADTPDFGRKKEIRARMYKLREQRLKDFYTAGDVGQVTRKHQTTRHTESIGDQGFLSMKTKEIRDSESPTRDFSRAIISTTNDNNGYWNSRQENSAVTQDLDGGGLMRETLESTEGRGIIRGEDCETELALGSENRHTKVSKKDENSSYEGEALNQSSKMASVTKSDTGMVSTAKAESCQVSKSHEESKSADQQSTTKSWSSSSRSVSSSSKKIVSSSSYRVSSDGETMQAITSDTSVAAPEILQFTTGDLSNRTENDTVDRNESRSESRVQSSVNRSEEVRSSSTQRRDENISEKSVIQKSDQHDIKHKYLDQVDGEQIRVIKTITSENPKNRLETVPHTESHQLIDDRNVKSKDVDVTEIAKTNDTRIINNKFSKTESVKSETESVTNQKIMSEIQKLDSYLSTHTPAPSTPVSPHSTTDVANWTIVSKDNRDNEFTYEPRATNQVPEKVPSSPRGQERVDKNLSNLDLPKDATEGQYVTTYQSHYTRPGRISVDNSPSHDYFASTLRSSPDRQTPSPNKKSASRGSLDRSSPERKWRQSPRTTSSPSTERGTPESRPQSRPTDRKSPERKQRTSPSKTPDRETPRRSPVKSPERERKSSTSSYTIERPKSETRKKSEAIPDNKPKRKFSSSQQKQATKARASTPGSSPTRKTKPDPDSDTDSDNSQATFNKSKSDIRTASTEERETTAIQKVNSLPKEESSEYFSEGSVTNELKRQESPERRAFTPIKNFRTNPESGTFIVGERRQIIQESEISTEDRDDRTDIVDDGTVQIVVSRKDNPDRPQNSLSPSPSLGAPASRSPEKQTDNPEDTISSQVKEPTPTPSSMKIRKDVTSKQASETRETTVTEVSRGKKTDESRKKINTDSDRSASVSPERKTPRNEKRASPERRTTENVTPVRKPQDDSPTRDSQKKPIRKASRDSPDRKSPSRARSSPEKSPSASPERKQKSTRNVEISGRSPDRYSKSSSASPERTSPKRSSPERKPASQSPVRKTKEVSGTKVESSSTHITRRRSSIPTPDHKTIPQNVRAKPQATSPAKSTPSKNISSTQKPSNITPPKQSVRAPTKQSPQVQPSQSPQKQPQRSIQKPSTVRTQKLPEHTQRATPKSNATSTVTTQRQVTKVTTTKVVKNQEKPWQTSAANKPHTITVTPKKSPNVTPQKQPATPSKGSPALNSRTPSTKSVPSRLQPVKSKEPETRLYKGQVSTPKTRTATVRQTGTKTKTVNQLKTQQFIETECECLDETTDLEDVAPPDHFDVEVDEEDEPKEQYEEIDVRSYINRKVQRKTSKDKLKQDRKLIKRGISKDGESSSSSEDETDRAPTNETSGVTKRLLTAETNQDYLNVVVQHPKSSRESSPGYPSERIPVSTTSDDGESNPRYADFISEPEDVEIFDTLRGTRGPIPVRERNVQTTDLDDEDDGTRPSVADKVNLFLEAAKHSLEPQESHQPVEIDGSHSVRSAKNLFENISKTQATTVQTNKTVDIFEKSKDEIAKPSSEIKPSIVRPLDEPRHVSPSVAEPSAVKPSEKSNEPSSDVEDETPATKTFAYQDRAVANEPEFIRKKAYETHEKEVIKETQEFKKREVEETKKPGRKVTPLSEPSDKTNNQPTKKPFTRNISASADVNSKRSFFERKAHEEGKPQKQPKDEVRTIKKETDRKSSTGNSDSFMKSTVASSVRGQSPEKVQKPERKRTSENLGETKPSSQPSDIGSRPGQVRETSPVRRALWRQEEVERKTSTDITNKTKDTAIIKETADITSVRTVRKQSPSKEITPKTAPKDKTFTSTKSFDQDDDLRSPLKVRDSNTIVSTVETEEIKKSSGTFGVTLKKTPSNAKILPAVAAPLPKKITVAGDSIIIEEIFDLEILEKMLIKAVGYDERRSIRAQIKLVKKKLEEEHNRSGSEPTPNKSAKPKTWTPKEKSPERTSSTATSRKIEETNRFKGEEKWGPSSRRSPERKPSTDFKQTTTTTTTSTTTTTTQSRESPERRLTSQKSRESPERRLPKQRSRDSPEKTVVRQPSRSSPERKVSAQSDKRTNIKSDSKETNQVTTYHATVKTQSTRNVTSEVKEASATDSITSSYGVGPTDDDGKPLFGLRALRRTNTNKALEGDAEEVEEVVIEKDQTRKDSATEDILDSSGRPLFGGLKALQSEAMPAPTNQLKSLVERNQYLVQGGSTMESTKTVVTSHSSFSSDGKVSHRREVVRGELSAKNGEQPVGKVTQSSYSYQKGNEKGSTPQITSKTVTSVIGGRRNSGPKIEEITDGSQTASSSRRFSKEYTVEEDSTTLSDRRRSSTGLNEENVRAFTSILRNKDEGVRKSSLETDDMKSRKTKSPSQEESVKRSLTRGDSIKALQHKYQQATEAANQVTSRTYPKAGLILRSNSLHGADDQNQLSSTMKTVSTSQTTRTTDADDAVVTSSSTRTSEDARTLRSATPTASQVTTSSTRTEVKSSGATSFLDNSSKVTGVQDILNRMRNADLVSESGDTTEDAEARALLNKFLGASVILQGMEQGMRAAATHSSTALVNEVDKQWVKATSQRTQDDLNDIYDEKQLQILLDACSDYDERRKIRARLREVMAEKKGGSSEVAGVGGSGLAVEGECLSIQRVMSGGGFDDSGTESGEDLRHLNPEVVEEVKSALSRLEGVIPGLDPVKRDAVSQLVTSLQSCLQLAPPPPPPVPPPRRFGSRKALRNRHTVSVTADELVQARKWVDQDNLQRNSAASSESILSKVFRPVRFSPPATLPEVGYTQMTLTRKMFHKPTLHRAGCFMEPGPQQGVISYFEPEYEAPPVERSISDSSSVYDYDPSIHLFTPEQSVQIAVHKAAINKQINREEVKRRGSSEDGDVSSADEEEGQEVSSAQRLLQLASEGEKKTRFSVRNSKKLKMKRANTIDIPKPNKFYDYSSDDYGASADETRDDMGRRGGMNNNEIFPPSFEPKTENDHKFLAFLQQVNDKNPPKAMSYNPSARGGKHWQNRFSTIKTTFEGGEKKTEQCYSPSPAKLFWQNTQKEDNSTKIVDQKTPKLPWTVKSTNENGVVVGSLTVSKPGQMNRFNHAPKSAFKPVEKKPFSPLVSPASGSVKQLVNQKFSQSQQSSFEPKTTVAKLEVKTTPSTHVIQKKENDKLASFNQNAVMTHKYYNIPSNVVNQEQPERRTPSAFAPYKQKTEAILPKTQDAVKSSPFNSYSQPKYNAVSSVPRVDQGEQNLSNKNGKFFQSQYVSSYKHQPGPFHNASDQSLPHPRTPKKTQVESTRHVDDNQQYDQRMAANNQIRANKFVPKKQELNGNQFSARVQVQENQYQYTPINHQSYETKDPKPTYNPKNQNLNQYRPHNDTFFDQGSLQPYPDSKPQLVHVPANTHVIPPIINHQSNLNPTLNGGANVGGLNHSINSKFIPVTKPIAKVYPEQQPIVPQPDSYYSATINGCEGSNNNVVNLEASYDLPDHQIICDYATTPSAVSQANNIPPIIESQGTSFDKIAAQSRNDYESDRGLYQEDFSAKSPLPIDYRVHNTPPGSMQYNKNVVHPIIGTVTDCSTLNQEIQNLTDITDTRILESQDQTLSNEAAGGQYICNLRDASTINTDGEFVSNILATSPGIRDSHFISPRPRSKSPKIDTPSSLPPTSFSANMLEMNNMAHDNVYYNNTAAPVKPPNSLSFYSPNGDSPRVKERPKTSSPYQSGRIQSPQSPSPVRSTPTQFSPDGNDEQECKAISKVMGQAQCQAAVTINNRTRRRFDEPTKLDLRIQLTQSARQRALSPSFPNVLQKSESWHQLVKEQMQQAKQAPPVPNGSLPKISRAKSSHNLSQYKQFEASLQPDANLATKKITVSQYLSKQAKHSHANKQRHKSLGNIATFDDDLEDVDEAFESIFLENSNKRKSK